MPQHREPASAALDLGRCLDTVARCRGHVGALLMNQQPQASDLTAALLDAVALFDELGIGYALIGGLAAMYYGRARFTEDVDFVAGADHQTVLANHPEAVRRHRFDPSCTYMLYHDTGVEIDLWKDEHVEGIIARSRSATLAGRTVRVVDPHDLVAMKLRADRPQDDYDIAEVLKHTPIDDALIRQRVDDERFAHYQAVKRRIARA